MLLSPLVSKDIDPSDLPERSFPPNVIVPGSEQKWAGCQHTNEVEIGQDCDLDYNNTVYHSEQVGVGKVLWSQLHPFEEIC